ncbi:MAG: DUF692 domain-containing protein [Ahniella sp.]|nr:DUF692 domain-containing protein [Ahniella sp.]
MSPAQSSLTGAGLGLRRALLGPLQEAGTDAVDFLEVAPENWIGVGGNLGKRFRALTERWPLVCHGLSLSIGAPSPLDETFLAKLKRFLELHQVPVYSEHLSYCGDDGHLYDLMPIPFTEAAVRHVSARIRRVQDVLGRRIALENVSYYTPIGAEMTELDFILEVLRQADCDLLLDVNNIHVNSVNHRYDALAFLRGLPSERVAYVHIAGHYNEAPDLIVDTHGANVVAPVWKLLDEAYACFGAKATLLERDFNIPPMAELRSEIEQIRSAQRNASLATDRPEASMRQAS